jgi:hypothetical protein
MAKLDDMVEPQVDLEASDEFTSAICSCLYIRRSRPSAWGLFAPPEAEWTKVEAYN